MKNEFTFNQIAHLNAALADKELHFHIDYKDGQTAGIQEESSCACSGKEDLARQEISSFFAKEGMQIKFSDDNIHFSPVG